MKLQTYASIGKCMNYFSDEIMTKCSWIVQRNDQKIAKWAIGSQYNKVDLRVAIAIVFVYRARRIYSKVYQGKSNTLITVESGVQDWHLSHWHHVESSNIIH